MKKDVIFQIKDHLEELINSFSKILQSVARNSHQRCSVKKSVLKNLANFTEKHLCWSLFLIKLQAFRPVTLLKKVSNTSVCLWNLWSYKEHLFWRTSANDCFSIATFTISPTNFSQRSGCKRFDAYSFFILWVFFTFQIWSLFDLSDLLTKKVLEVFEVSDFFLW